MTNVIDAEVKISRLIDLLRTAGGLRIEAEILDESPVGIPEKPGLSIELSGPDQPVLLHNNAELLQAIQHFASAVLRLGESEADQLWFDAGNTKADRNGELKRLAEAGIEIVKSTSRPYRFPPMMACERRLLHLALASSGLKAASTGFGEKRSVVLYPEGIEPPLERIPTQDEGQPGERRSTAA